MQSEVKRIQASFSEAIQSYCSNHQGQANKNGYMTKLLQECRINQLPSILGSSTENGLSQSKVETNKSLYGQNRFLRRKTKTFGEIFKETLCDEMLIVLIIAAIFSIIIEFFFGEDKSRFWVDGVSILFAVLICTIVGTFSNYQKQKQFEQLDQMTELTYNYDVIRNGKRIQLHRSDIVSGDMIMITNGMEIPADCIIYKAIDVIVDESAITGESVELLKNNIQRCNPNGLGDSPLMISGSAVISGEGLMMAVVVGRNSHNGKNFEMIFNSQDDEEKTPLEQKLDDMGKKIGYLGLVAGIFVVAVLIIRLLIHDIIDQGFDVSRDLPEIIKYLIIGITLLVAAIPEGLPLAVTLTLAFSMKQMHEEKILVRKLASCETMGSSQYICTDKTGTITSNKMRVRRIINMSGIQESNANFNQNYKDILVKCISHNSSAILQPLEKGPQTQIALLHYIKDSLKANPTSVRSSISENDIFKRIPFNSMRKRMTTGVRHNGQNILYTSGASEKILQCCQFVMDPQTGSIIPMEQNIANDILKNINFISNDGMRVVGIGYKNLNQSQVRSSVHMSHQKGQIQTIQKDGFVFLGLFGIQDLPRPESKDSIEKAYQAGIKVIMITGDNALTASKIAREVGIIRSGSEKTYEGAAFIDMLQKNGLLSYKNPEGEDNKKQQDNSIKQIKKVYFKDQKDRQKFDRIIEGFAVMSRSRPEHKYILVDALIKRGNVVSVTGDGSNDAPALKRASVGLAMGQIGTQSAKNASDIVVLDDRFDSIVRAIVWGRNVFNSIRKFLQFQLTINMLLIFITILSSVLIRQSVFTAVQLLWFNLIMDSLAAVALASQPPNEEQLLRQPPNSQQDSLLTKTMMKHIALQSLFQLAVTMILLFTAFYYIPEFSDSFDNQIGKDLQAKYYQGEPQGNIRDGRSYFISGQENYKPYLDKYHVYSRHFTLLFNVVVFLQIFNFFCCRKINDELNLLKGICSSFIFWGILLAIIIVQIIVVEFLGDFFGLYKYGLTLVHWGISIGIGFSTILASMVIRLLPFWKPQKKYADNDKIDN